MSFKMEASGFDQIMKQLDGASAKFDAAVSAAALEVAEKMIEQAKEFVTSQSVSVAGSPPMNVTGELLASMTARAGQRPGSAEAVAGVFYALHLEYGTKKMAARPFMGPAARAVFMDGRKLMKSKADSAFGL